MMAISEYKVNNKEYLKNLYSLEYHKNNNRIDLLDFFRGFAMLLVMMQHSGFPSKFLLAFHMPLFFYLSGLVASERIVPSFGKYIEGRFKRLMIPYFCFGILTLLFNLLFCHIITGESLNIGLAVLGIMTGQYGFVPPALSALYWFLFVMFIADLLVYPFNKYFSKNSIVKLGGAVLFIILSYITTHGCPISIFTIDKAFVGATFVLVGEISKPLLKNMWSVKNLGQKEIIARDFLVFLVACLGLLLSVKLNSEKVLMYLNQYGNYAWFFLGAISGIIAALLAAKYSFFFLNKRRGILYKLMMWIGFNSLVMFPVHLMVNSYMKGVYSLIGHGAFPLRFLMMFLLGIPICNMITNYLPWMLGQKKF